MPSETPKIDTSKYFDWFDTKWIKELIEAKAVMETLLEQLVQNGGKLWEPLIVWIHSWPWKGKSHLLSALEKGLQDTQVTHMATHRHEYGIPQQKKLYKAVPVIITDDLFQWTNSLPKHMSDTGNKWWYEYTWLPELIFDIYEGNKVWIVSSNFDIHDILERVAESDTEWRLKSRIAHLLASVQPLNLNAAPDHREILAEQGTKLTKIFAGAVARALDNSE